METESVSMKIVESVSVSVESETSSMKVMELELHTGISCFILHLGFYFDGLKVQRKYK